MTQQLRQHSHGSTVRSVRCLVRERLLVSGLARHDSLCKAAAAAQFVSLQPQLPKGFCNKQADSQSLVRSQCLLLLLVVCVAGLLGPGWAAGQASTPS